MTLLEGDSTHLSVAYYRSAPAGATLPAATRERLEGVFACHLALAQQRAARTATVRVYGDEIGPAVQIVNDDMPLLVESVLATVRRMGATVTEVLHPIFDVTRDESGQLRSATAHEHDHNGPDPHTVRESWIHVQLGPDTAIEVLARLASALPPLLDELRCVSDDTPAIEAQAAALALLLAATSEQPGATARVDSAQLLNWLADGHFTWLGYARCQLVDGTARRVADTGLGLLRTDELRLPEFGSDHDLLLTQGAATDSIHGCIDPYFVGVPEYDSDGRPTAVRLFVGMFTVTALHAGILDIPVIERKARTVIEWSGFDPNSFSGKEMLEVLQSLPRVELFSSPARRLFETTSAVLNLGLRRQVRLFLREDSHSHVVSCLVYLPRDRYTTGVRQRMRDILAAEFDTENIDYSARVTESDLANLYFTVRCAASRSPADTSEANRRRIQELLIAATRTWTDLLVQQAVTDRGADSARARVYGEAFPEAYRQDFTPAEALADMRRFERLADGRIDVRLYRRAAAASDDWRFTLYVAGQGVSLSRVMPVLRSLGVEVIDERPYRLDLADETPRWIYDFGLRTDAQALRARPGPEPGPDGHAPERFAAAFAAIWADRLEIGSLNELVLQAGLDWREVSVLRGYTRYLQQAQFSYSGGTISRVLLAHPDTATLLARLFAARFDPDLADAAHAAELQLRLVQHIDAVLSLDTDRILRALLGLVTATLRTNFYVVDSAGNPPDCLSFKFAPGRIAELPKPKPLFEIFVYSPRVEGVHLRFGAVARGGLRWSDRREDFRTEILGLVKAQAVKNAVIVPMGAKGGFVVKNPPPVTGDANIDRAAALAEGVACYQLFISGLLDVTDNLDPSGATVPPARVVRHDSDDSYLVVAADKGTAAFSDIANEVAARYRFWLGDAFASGGSVGYDHKAMGITAKGAWESVQRHFREMAIDTQTTDFTVVGVGDMSGDVFGNGMLLSRHIRLVAAFDHRHVFLDPNPDATVSFAERTRLFALSRSSWADYDPALISAGGGVYDRTAKAIPISAQVRTALGLAEDVESLSPPQLVRTILLAPVDLLWNGGIGTYIKASAETNADVGDKSNDAVRVDGDRLRVKVIGEGGNLGATMLGRIEFARRGGRINTDALDNSAGVDCSDHEVNIKILLQRAIIAGALHPAERDALLASMTDEVAELVLRDNISQNFLMGLSRAEAAPMAGVHRRLIDHLAQLHGVDRDLEALPPDAEMKRRIAEGNGLTSPELATLLAHVKLTLKAELLASDLLDNPTFARLLPEYFPAPLRERFHTEIKTHPLRRSIVATILVNDMVDHAGITYAFRLAEEAGAATTDAVRAFTAAMEIFGLRGLWHRIRSADMPTAVRDELETETERTLDRASRWLLSNRPQPIAIGADINRYATGVRELTGKVPAWLLGYHVTDLVERSRAMIDRGAPPELAVEVFRLIHLFPLLDILDIADIADRDGEEVAALYYALNDHLKIEWLLTAVHHLERGDRWHALARLAVRDDMYSSLRSLTLAVLSTTEPDETAAEKIAYWESTNQSRIGRARNVLAEVLATTAKDLATLSVAARQVRSMVPDGR